MAILASELKAYQSASMPENDTGASGGAIAVAGKVEFTDLAANGVVTAVSDGADTRTATVTGRNAAGAIVSEVLTLAGTTRVVGTTTFERILKIVLSAADAARLVTVTRNDNPTYTAIATLEPNITSTRRLFYDSASEAGATTRYEKIFLKNTNATLTLNAAVVKLTADPAATIRIATCVAKDDTTSVANRKTAPAGVTFVDDNVNAAVPGNTLEAGVAIGVWIEMQRGAGAAAIKNTFSTELSGTSV